MDKSLKNKNLLVLVFEIIIIILAVVGITFATSRLLNNRSTTIIKAGEYNLDYVGSDVVTAEGLEPISDELINIDSESNVLRVEFSLRGVKENDNDNLIYDVMLSDMVIDCSLLNEYTKWNLYKNGSLVANGNMSPKFDGDVYNETMRLTNLASDLPLYDQEYDNYVFIMWISESCDNIETCKLVDQSNIASSKMNMKIFIALYSGEKIPYERVSSNDTSCANRPVLDDGMIPVTYHSGQWVLADDKNIDSEYLWYDYSNSKWANSLVVKDKYKYSDVGSVINSDDIMGYFVWIPRFRYKLWNAADNISDSYNAYDNGIDIIFENGLDSSLNEEIINDKYVTHAAFSDNLIGFWISKYEISQNGEEYRFIPSTYAYRKDSLDNYKSIASNIATDYNLTLDSHIINNLEWGATLYLSHSKYGVCDNDGCVNIGINDSYTSGFNKQDTTTRNVYGVYDMAGGSSEYVVGSDALGSATSEVILKNGDTWYNGHGLVSDRDYIIRGGIGLGLFYFGDISMNSVEISTRVVLSSK